MVIAGGRDCLECGREWVEGFDGEEEESMMEDQLLRLEAEKQGGTEKLRRLSRRWDQDTFRGVVIGEMTESAGVLIKA